ncbi:DNA-binding protein WhiA [Gardnerella piotii]|uniref:DNA-binding protein WhiA n=1 Tax=Gardnerella TaxID=2701 RepID=UPI0039EDFF25
MALLDDVKNELVANNSDQPAVIMAQAAAMMRFAGGLRPVNNQAVIRAQFDSQNAAQWLVDVLETYFQREAKISQASRQTPTGVVTRYEVLVDRGAAALALQSGLLDRRMRIVAGLAPEIVSGSIAQIKAAWRGAFIAHGAISDPGKASYLEIVCPTHEAATALQAMAARLGVSAKARKVKSSERVTLRDSDAIERMLNLIGAPRSSREWTGKRSDGEARGKANRLANFDDANMRRSAKAAAEACEKVRHAFDVLGDDIPENLLMAGKLRLKHSDASLEELGHLADPPITKDAVAGRIRRLLQLCAKVEKSRM